METTYVYYPAKKVFRILTSAEPERKGYKVMHWDDRGQTLILRKNRFLLRRRFFEIRLESSGDAITCIRVNQIYSENLNTGYEKEVVSDLLKIF